MSMTLKIQSLRILFRLALPLIRLWERRLLARWSGKPLKHQPLFIIGAPRTGSTILYQVLTNIYDVQYVDNLACALHRSLPFGLWLSRLLFGERPHDNFRAVRGNTMDYGLHAPSECGQIWYHWLPRDHHYIDEDEITDEMVTEIRDLFTAIINENDRPLIINNNNAALRLKLLTRVFPEARWIVCRRDPLYVSQSLLNAREGAYGDRAVWWSMLPKNYKTIQQEEPVIQVVQQTFYVNKHIHEDVPALISADRYLWFDYEKTNSEFYREVEHIARTFGLNSLREGGLRPDYVDGNRISLNEAETEILQAEIDRFDWVDFSNDFEEDV